MADDVTIVVRVNDRTAAGFRDVNGRLRDMNGRFASAAGDMRRSSSTITRALVDVKASLLSLAPAAVPVAASLTGALLTVSGQAAGAATAMAAFGAAVVPQVRSMGRAAQAQTKYSDAVRQYGETSKQAAQAQLAMSQTLSGMPKETQRASAAYSNLKDEFQTFSDSTAKFTMAPVEKSFAVLGQIIPKLTPMVEGTSTQLDRLMNVAGGAVNTSGFDSLSEKVSDFSNKALKNATDEAIHFIRVLSEGDASGPITQFMDYAREQGPAVKELLSNLARAVANLAEGAAQAGPGLLSVVNALAKMVAALPPSVIGNLMQVYAAFKLITLAGAGFGAVASGIATLRTSIAGLTTASAAAGGGLAGLKAAFLSLSIGARAALITTGVGAIVVALGMLSSQGEKTPPDVDKVTTSLKGLAETGKNTGEAARAWGTDFDGLSKSLSRLKPSGFDGFLQSWANFLGTDSTQVKNSKEDIDALDKSLAGLVKGGNADTAAKALERVGKKLKPKDFKELKNNLDDYKSALADAALESELTAESQGLFGEQAQKTQTKLDSQKASADGLRQSIQALNDVNRQGLGGMIGFEAAIDSASKAAKENAGSLSMHNGVLNLNSEKSRNAASALQDLADKTESAAASQREAGASWETVNGVYDRGRKKLIESAQAMGLTKSEAKQLADQILNIKELKKSRVEMNTEDATRDLNAFNAAVKRSPGSKSVTLKTLSKSAEQVLEAFGYKVKRLPNGKVTVSAKTGSALSGIKNVQSAVNSLHGKTVTVTINGVKTGVDPNKYYSQGPHAGKAHGGLLRRASGGPVQHFDGGGYIQGPGTPTSDSITATFASGAGARVSTTEYVVQSSAVRKYGVGLLDALNAGRLKLAGFARGGLTGGQLRGLSSPSDMSSLKSTLSDVRTRIKDNYSGATEARLLRTLDSYSKKLIAQEKSLTSVNKALASAKDKLNDLKSSASQLASSVKSGVLSSANITKGAGGDTPVTTASIMGGLTASRDKATAFSSALKSLKSKGLSSSLIQQIAEAGIEGGGLETAGALLGASSSEISSINDLQSQINSAATSAGKTTADSVYGAAIKKQTEATERLKKSQDKLEKAMADLAKSLNKSLGGKAAGGIVGGAASGGLRSGLTWVGEHEPELLQLPAGSRVWSGPDSRRKAGAPWSSMLTAPRRARAAAGGGGGGSQEVRVVLEIRAGDSGRYTDFLVKELRGAVKANGSIEATLRPPRGR